MHFNAIVGCLFVFSSAESEVALVDLLDGVLSQKCVDHVLVPGLASPNEIINVRAEYALDVSVLLVVVQGAHDGVLAELGFDNVGA